MGSPTPRVEHKKVVEAIAAAERLTTAEIRVVVSRHPSADPYKDATTCFERLGLGHSAHKSAVLIFVSPWSKRFAVIGDAGVHAKCGDAFWKDLVGSMTGYFKRNQLTEGIIHGVARAGELLAQQFPRP